MMSSYFDNVCTDPRTLRKTPRTTDTKSINGGCYVHSGLIKYIILLLIDQRYKDVTSIGLQLNFDGVEISDGHMWPQQARIVLSFTSTPFLVGTYYGKKNKLDDVEGYLNDLILELVIAMRHGVEHPTSGNRVRVWMHSVCVLTFLQEHS